MVLVCVSSPRVGLFVILCPVLLLEQCWYIWALSGYLLNQRLGSTEGGEEVKGARII